MHNLKTKPVVKKAQPTDQSEPVAPTPTPAECEDSPATSATPQPAAPADTDAAVSGSVPPATALAARTVPYSRFATVAAARRAAEEQLATLQSKQKTTDNQTPTPDSTQEETGETKAQTQTQDTIPDPTTDPEGYAQYIRSAAASAAAESLAPYLAAQRETELAADLTAAQSKYPLADPELTYALLALNPELDLTEAARLAHTRVAEIRSTAEDDYRLRQARSRRGAAEGSSPASAITQSRPRTLAEATEVATAVFSQRLGS